MSQVREIELTIEEAKKKIEKKNKLLQLIDNPLFDEIITKGYFELEPQRLAVISAEPSLLDADSQKNIAIRLQSIGFLRQYFLNIRREAAMAEKAIADGEEELTAIRQEEVGG
jgi:hypothetical protein